LRRGHLRRTSRGGPRHRSHPTTYGPAALLTFVHQGSTTRSQTSQKPVRSSSDSRGCPAGRPAVYSVGAYQRSDNRLMAVPRRIGARARLKATVTYPPTLMSVAVALAFSAVSSASSTQGCMQYPPGPQRFACASQLHPGLAIRLERCKEEGRAMGLLRATGGRQALGHYVMACMQRRGGR
jgi:hypothetical protein